MEKIERVNRAQETSILGSGEALRTAPNVVSDMTMSAPMSTQLNQSLDAKEKRITIPKKLFDGAVSEIQSGSVTAVNALKLKLTWIPTWPQYAASKFYSTTDGVSLRRWFGRLMGWHKFAQRVDVLKEMLDNIKIPDAPKEQVQVAVNPQEKQAIDAHRAVAATKIQAVARGRKVRSEVVLPKQIRQVAGQALAAAGLSDQEQINISRVLAHEIHDDKDAGTRLEADNKLYSNPDMLPEKKEIAKAKARLDTKTLEASRDIIAQKNRFTVVGNLIGSGSFKNVSESVEVDAASKDIRADNIVARSRTLHESKLDKNERDTSDVILRGMNFINKLTKEEIKKYNIVVLKDLYRTWNGKLQASAARYIGNAQKLAKDMNEKQKYNLIKTIARTLQFFHQQKNWVHRDVKLENILLDDQHNAYLNDHDTVCEAGKRNRWAGTKGFIDELSLKLGITTPYADVYALAQTASLLGCEKYRDMLTNIETENQELVDYVNKNPALKTQLSSTDPNIRRAGMKVLDARFPNFANFFTEVEKST